MLIGWRKARILRGPTLSNVVHGAERHRDRVQSAKQAVTRMCYVHTPFFRQDATDQAHACVSTTNH